MCAAIGGGGGLSSPVTGSGKGHRQDPGRGPPSTTKNVSPSQGEGGFLRPHFSKAPRQHAPALEESSGLEVLFSSQSDIADKQNRLLSESMVGLLSDYSWVGRSSFLSTIQDEEGRFADSKLYPFLSSVEDTPN